MEEKTRQANRQIKTVTWLGVWINISLTILKMIAGLIFGSMAVIADAVHSLSDLATDTAVLIGNYFGSKEADPEHPFGHGRMETFSAAFVAVALMVVGIGMIQQAAVSIARVNAGLAAPIHVGWILLGVTILSIVSKEVLYWLTRMVALRTHSSAVYANAWHHRSDAFSSVAVLVGLVAMRFGYDHGDQIAAIIVGLMVILVGLKVIGDCVQEFAERAVDADTIARIQTIIESQPRIRSWHKLRTRSVGREIFLDLHILVEPSLSITDAHDVSEQLERTLHIQLARPVNITVHIEPDLEQLRK